MLSETAIRAMIAAGESSTVEFKLKPPRPAEIAERICGMANTRIGGTIIFGVADADSKIVGLAALSQATDIVLRAARMLKPVLTLRDGGPQTYDIDGHILLIAEVPPNDGTLYQASGVFWVRKGTHTVPMSSIEVGSHLHTSGALRWERNLCKRATLADLDQTRIERYLELRGEQRVSIRYTSREELLLGMDCVAIDPEHGTLHPTNAGLLMFGHHPQFYIPHSEVVCVRYADNLGVRTYVDRKNLVGTVSELINQAADFLKLNTRVGAEIIGFKRIDKPEYPLEALREAVVNAVVHRDYSREGETIRIFFYADRVEIHSPGLLPPGIMLADLVQMQAPSRPRNVLIAQLLRDIPTYMERVGAGIRFMTHEMRELNLPDPEFKEQHEFLVIFRNGKQIPEELLSELSRRQIMGLRLIQEQGSLTSNEYCTITGASDRTASRELREMVERGIIVVRGRTRAARYFLP